LEEYDSVSAWKSSLRPATLESWRGQKRDFNDYCVWRKKDPDAILAERKANRARDPESRLEEVGLDRYRESILKRGLAAGSAQKFVVTAISFFKHNYQELVFANFPTISLDEYKGAKRLSKEEVQKLYQFCDNHRDKLILLFGAESGLRVRALEQLRLGCFVATEDGSKEGVACESIEDFKGVMIPCRVQLPKRFYTSKRKREGITFVCQDFKKLLIEYLELRKKAGEPIDSKTPIFPTYKAKMRVLSTGTIVTRQRETWASPGSKVSASVTMGARKAQLLEALVLEIESAPLVNEGIEGLFRRLRKKANISYDPDAERPASPHSLRKYLHSALDAAGVNSTMVNTIIGHSNAIAEHYSGRKHLDVEEIRHAYESAMHRIAVAEETNGTRVLKLESNFNSQMSVMQDKINTLTEAIAQIGEANKKHESTTIEEIINKVTTKGADSLTPEEMTKFKLFQTFVQWSNKAAK
jgi:integrase